MIAPSLPRRARTLGRVLVLACLLLVFVTSCSSSGDKGDRKPVHPVRGQVFVKDKPAAGAFVVFIPVEEPPQPKDPRPRAEVEPDGSFALSMYGEKDGAPVGEYIVAITWPGGRDDSDDRLLGRYADRTKSKLRATVKEGPNEIPAFKLK